MADASGLADEVSDLFGSYRRDMARLDELRGLVAGMSEEGELLRREQEEIMEVDPSEEEYRELMDERRSLNRLADMADTLAAASEALAGEEESLSSRVRGVGAGLSRLGEELEQATELLEQAAIGLDEAAAICDSMVKDVEEAPWRLEELDRRLNAYSRLLARCGGSIEALMGRRAELEQRLKEIEGARSSLKRLEESVPELGARLVESARRLSDARAGAAGALEEKVTAELARLGMPDCRFAVSMEAPSGTHVLDCGGTPVCADGLERPAFAFSANPGMAPGPLSSVASGGELSRLALALRLALAEVRDNATMAFDEIDAGVGGRTAHLLAESLDRAASGGRQLLVITHLAQIAARARNHLAVSKETGSGMPVTEVTVLEGESRREEIARILGGGEAAMDHAGSMLRDAGR
jgi:DNA repair protein RecN (Recombination protein N)